MRIRKRQAPLPFSFLSPVPVSDPRLFSRLPVVQPANHPDADCVRTQIRTRDSDLRHMTGRKSDGDSRVYSQANAQQKVELKESLNFEGEEFDDERREEEESNDISKGRSALAAVANNGFLLPSISSSAVRRWCHGDMTVPLKKRIRGSLERNANREDPLISLEKAEKISTATMMKCKSTNNKKFLRLNGIEAGEGDGEDLEQREIETKYVTHVSCTASAKKSKRDSTIMGGSKCSRVNGRGWRCCQPTLVGYSLCEHHLGKGRLRSMTSMSSPAAYPLKKADISEQLSTTPAWLSSAVKLAGKPVSEGDGCPREGEEDDDDDGDSDRDKMMKKPLMLSPEKRVKLGMVKARSLSSLLGQTNQQRMQ
ncbi:hypothetical protein Nepgr_010050 [Nepenthes gracilis]|uniref:WRC domain-containing protein n=1 Tax=Nepenthes gracilis TaxID=150966 RepID=A0AAD3SBQ8_NEPGR|nr:hypothetical protein Nepgr_010050 [Nepenthes gracilis]